MSFHPFRVNNFLQSTVIVSPLGISIKIALFLLTFGGQGHRGVAQTSHGCSPRALGADALSGECLGCPKVNSLLRAPSLMTCGDQSVV